MAFIREMTFEDIDRVCAIEEENFSPAEIWQDTGFAAHLFRNDTLYLVAEDEGTVQGYAGILMVPDEADITKISVSAAMQGKGIGTALLQDLCARAKEQGIRKIYLEVRESNLPALRVYEKAGFVRTGVRKAYYTAPTEDAVLMEYRYA